MPSRIIPNPVAGSQTKVFSPVELARIPFKVSLIHAPAPPGSFAQLQVRITVAYLEFSSSGEVVEHKYSDFFNVIVLSSTAAFKADKILLGIDWETIGLKIAEHYVLMALKGKKAGIPGTVVPFPWVMSWCTQNNFTTAMN